MSKKTLTDQAPKHGCIGCMFNRSVVNHCVQVRRTFKILDIGESIRRELKKGARNAPRSHTVVDEKQDSPFLRQKRGFFFVPTRSRTHAPRFTATGLIPCTTDACYCCLSVVATYENWSMAFCISLVFAKPYA